MAAILESALRYQDSVLEEERDFSAAQVLIERRYFKTRFDTEQSALVLELPGPRFPAEARFVAILDRRPHSRFWLADEASPGEIFSDYFTSERTFGSELGGVFCAWTATGQHLNFGEHPVETRQEFEALLQRFLLTAV